MNFKENTTRRRIFVLVSVILLTVIYYFTSLYRIYIPQELPYFPEGRNSILFFDWLFGSLFNGSPWIDFWQYIWQFVMAFVLFLIVPMLIIKFYFKEPQKDYGWQWGEKKFNLIWTLIALAVVPAFFFFSDPTLAQEYPLTKLEWVDPSAFLTLFIAFNLIYFIYYIGFEFIYRAYLQFGLKGKEELGRIGLILIISISTVISVLFHIGKPMLEIIAAAAIGPLFGWLTLKGRSFIWPVLIFHFLMGVVQNITPLL